MNLLIKAGPGCGKSHTLKSVVPYMLLENKEDHVHQMSDQQKDINEWCCEHLPRTKSILYLAFQRSIADKLKNEVLPFCNVYSLNGYGQSVIIKSWGFQKLNSQRGANLIAKKLGRSIYSLPPKDKFKWLAILTYIKLLKQEDLPVTEEGLQFLQQKYRVAQPVPTDLDAVIDLMDDMQRNNKQLEYIDQLWIGNKLVKPTFDIALIDEFQDLSPIMLKLALRSAKNLIFCGDPHQSITRFAGAGDNIYEELQARCNKQLPLSVSFRVPPNIAEKANRIRKGDLSTVKTKPGREERIKYDDLVQMLRKDYPEEHAVLCRTNAPLISLGLRLMRDGIPVRLAKNDLYKRISYFMETCYKKGPDPTTHVYNLLDHPSKNKNQQMAEKDMGGIVMALWKEHKPTSAQEMMKRLEELTDPEDPPVDLSTIHRAKGLEWKNVTILNPPVFHPLAETPEEKEQEYNVEYVGITRTKENLFWLNI